MSTVIIGKTEYQIEKEEQDHVGKTWTLRKANTVKVLSQIRGAYILTTLHSNFGSGYGTPKRVQPIFNN